MEGISKTILTCAINALFAIFDLCGHAIPADRRSQIMQDAITVSLLVSVVLPIVTAYFHTRSKPTMVAPGVVAAPSPAPDPKA